MRQGQQQNRRGRGRGGRKGQSPLSRSFESSGPDIKIRGTAQHIAEKYMALARDAIGSGDLVLGENYLQHAEHYNRIIMAAQALPQNGYDQANGSGQRIARPEGDILQGDGMGDGDEGDDDGEGDQPGMNGGGFDQPRSFEPNGQRDHQNSPPQPQQHRNRDNRNFEHRNYDNRRNEPRSFEPRGQGGYSAQGNPDQRGGGEFRFQDHPRPVNGGPPPNGNVEQPRSVEPPAPRPFADQPRDARPVADGRPPDIAGQQRGRRRRGRHENGTSRVYPPQVGPMDSGADFAPAPTDARPPERSEGGEGGSGGSNGGNDGNDGAI